MILFFLQMPLIASSCIQAIKDRVSMVDVVSPYVRLRPAGRYWKGLSPFSHEKTPSFFVDPQRNTFKCFSSGYAGDVFRFLELKEQLTFAESVERLCEQFNIPLEYERRGGTIVRSNEGVSLRRILLDIYARAAQFFKQHFWSDDKVSKEVRAYWRETRHFSDETAKTFDIGFAPADGSLYVFLQSAGFSREHLQQSGLFYNPKRDYGNLMPRFQGRLMIPIKDLQDRTIAFSGRNLPFLTVQTDPTHEAKYVNSPETPLFIKGQVLFNLSKARSFLAKDSSFYLVEGQLDAMRCFECGLKTAVAPQGTGLTEEQLKLLKRYDAPIIGLFDGDEAGLKAGLRFMTLGIPLEIPLRYVCLEKDEDPDGFLLKNPKCCEKLTDEALSPVDFFIHAFKRNGCDDGTVQRNVLQAMFPIIAKCTSAVLRFDLLRELSKTFHLPQSALEADLEMFQRRTPVKADAAPPPQPSPIYEQPEGQVLRFLLHAPRWTEAVLRYLSLDWIDETHTVGRLLMRILSEFHENGIEPLDNRDRWNLSAEEEDCWCQQLAQPLPSGNEREQLTLLLQQMYRRFLKKRILEIDKRISKNPDGNIGEARRLQSDRLACKRALAEAVSFICLPKE